VVRLAIVDVDGKRIEAKDITSAMDLMSLADQARKMIRECEQLASARQPKPGAQSGRVPYS